MAWYWIAAIGWGGFIVGVFVIAIVAAGKCAECETIERIRRAGK
jgi:hypothetical protein